MCSVNQIHGQIKLLEMWKAVNVEKIQLKSLKSQTVKTWQKQGLVVMKDSLKEANLAWLKNL